MQTCEKGKNMLRELTINELEVVSGGSTLDMREAEDNGLLTPEQIAEINAEYSAETSAPNTSDGTSDPVTGATGPRHHNLRDNGPRITHYEVR